MRSRRRPFAATVLLTSAAVAAVVAAVAGCSSDEPADPTTTTARPTTTAPTTTAPDAANDQPMPVSWVRQVGGAGNDVINSSTGRGGEVLGFGTTTGISDPLASGSTAAFVDLVAAADGSPKGTIQSPQVGAGTGLAISAAEGTETTVACGATGTDEQSDAWCTNVGPDGSLGNIAPIGSDQADRFDAVTTTPDGTRVYAAGRSDGLFPEARDPTGGFIGGGDALVVRLDATGAIRWARQFGTTELDEANGVTHSDDGDAIVVGATAGRTDGDVSGTLGGIDAWAARMDPDGNQRWLTQFGTDRTDRAAAVAGGGDPRRGSETFVAAGSTDGTVSGSTNVGGSDALVAAFDASGDNLWTVQLGSTGEDVASGVAVDGSTVYVTGTTAAEIVGGQRIPLTPSEPEPGQDPSSTAPPSETTVPPGGGKDGFIAAFDLESGSLRWVAQFGSVGDDVVTDLTRTESGLIVVSGSTTGQLGTTAPGGGSDGFMVAFVPPSGGGGSARIVSTGPVSGLHDR